MNDGGLNDKQFIAIALIIVLCGFAIFFHDYFMTKKTETFESMSLLLTQEPSVVYENEEGTTTAPRTHGDPSGKVKKQKGVTYNYAGRIKIPKIKLNRGFLKYGQRGNNVNQNVAVMGGSHYPNVENSNFILASHSGSGWNAFFNNVDRLKNGDYAYIDYAGREYKYQMFKRYSDRKRDSRITIYYYGDGKFLTLVTCKKPDYRTYYLVTVFRLVSEKEV